MKKMYVGTVLALLLGVSWADGQMPYGPGPGYGPPGFPPPPPPWAGQQPGPGWNGPYGPPPYGYPPPPYPVQYPNPGPQGMIPPPVIGKTPDLNAAPPVRSAAEPPTSADSGPAPPMASELGGDDSCGMFCERNPPPCWTGWVTPEFLYWFAKGQTTPPLVTTTNNTALPGAALGTAGTTTLFGGDVNFPGMSGFRATIGSWIDPDKRWGIEGSAFVFENAVVNYTTTSSALPVVSVPIFVTNPLKGAEGFVIVSNGVFPASGSVNVQFASQLWGGELNGLFNVLRSRGLNVDVLYGARYQSLTESFSLQDNTSYLGNSYMLSDNFGTTNQFIGGQLGVRMDWQWKHLFLAGTLKAALGVNHEVLSINGFNSTTPTGGGTTVTAPGGIFAQSTNIGTQMQNNLSAIPQLQLKIGWEVIPNLRLFAGYDFMYWCNVVRPADQIDRNVNVTQYPVGLGGLGGLSGQAAPASMFNTTNYYAQGFSVGVEFRW